MMIIKNITNGINTTKKAAMYYKTEPFYVNVQNYVHTNNWEILQAIKILNHRGYSVDLIDRGCTEWNPTEPYDLFLGLGVGNTGRNFVKWATKSRAPRKVLLSMGPQPDVSNKLVLERYRLFNERTSRQAPPMRTVEEVTGDKFLEMANTATHIFNIGEKNIPSYKSLLGYDRPVLNFYPSISPKVNFNENWLNSRKMNSFLCFAGNGFICKGVDLVVESFLKTPDKELHICGPASESAFFEYYKNYIDKSDNIKYHGFIEPGGERFNDIASKCSFVVFHSAAEGCCTSVATAMKAGLVPIVNDWTGILIDNSVIEIESGGDFIKNITQSVNAASKMSQQNYEKKVSAVLEKTNLFSQESFTKSYAAALDAVEGIID